jgi:hypothetical protein
MEEIHNRRIATSEVVGYKSFHDPVCVPQGDFSIECSVLVCGVRHRELALSIFGLVGDVRITRFALAYRMFSPTALERSILNSHRPKLAVCRLSPASAHRDYSLP